MTLFPLVSCRNNAAIKAATEAEIPTVMKAPVRPNRFTRAEWDAAPINPPILPVPIEPYICYCKSLVYHCLIKHLYLLLHHMLCLLYFVAWIPKDKCCQHSHTIHQIRASCHIIPKVPSRVLLHAPCSLLALTTNSGK